jgi:hypothetical protein
VGFGVDLVHDAQDDIGEESLLVGELLVDAALTAGLALTAAMFMFAGRFVAERRMGSAIGSAAVGAVYFALPWTNAELASLLLVIASLIGWGWVSVMAWRLTAQSRSALPSGTPHAQPA